MTCTCTSCKLLPSFPGNVLCTGVGWEGKGKSLLRISEMSVKHHVPPAAFFPSFPGLLKWIILLTTHFYAYIFRKRRFKGSQEKGNEGSWFYYPCLHVCIPQFVLFSCILKCHHCICAIFYETGSGERAGGRKDQSFEKVRFIWLFIAVLRRVKCQHRFWSFYLQRKKTWVHPRAMHSGESSHLSPMWTAFKSWHGRFL